MSEWQLGFLIGFDETRYLILDPCRGDPYHVASGLKATIRLPCHAGPQGMKRYKRFCWSTWRGLAGEGNTNCVRPGVHTRIGDPDFFILGVDRQQRGMTSYSHAAAPHVFGTTANSAA